jgi:serine/threonine protein kinase
VIDFGIAKLRSATFGAGRTGLTAAGTVFGTPEYMAPEIGVFSFIDDAHAAFAELRGDVIVRNGPA